MSVKKPFYGMYHTNIDQKGRMQLAMRIRACLPDDIIIIGMRDHFELWDREDFEKHARKVDLPSDMQLTI